MSMQPDLERKKAQGLKRLCLFIMGGCLYVGLWLGAAWLRNGQDLQKLMESALSDYCSMHEVDADFIVHISKWPGALMLFPTQSGWVAAALMAGAFFCLSEYPKSRIIRTQNDHFGFIPSLLR